MASRVYGGLTALSSKLVSRGSAITEGSIVSGEFSNKVAVVTGGSRGIGREIAADLARAGAQTVIVSSSAENLAAASRAWERATRGKAARRPSAMT
jgi:3-oxoacyl-ACP reductase-like protein